MAAFPEEVKRSEILEQSQNTQVDEGKKFLDDIQVAHFQKAMKDHTFDDSRHWFKQKGICARHPGKHALVFEHEALPNCVIKYMKPESAKLRLRYLQETREIVQSNNLDYCVIPKAMIINERFYVMEKMEGCNFSIAEELSEIAYQSFNSDQAAEEKWREFFHQAAIFICNSGYWDVGWSNIILLNDNKGFGFVDFEKIEQTSENVCEGIERLLSMAPPKFFDMIINIAATHGIEDLGDIPKLKQRRTDQLALNHQVRSWHSEKNIKDGTYTDLLETLSDDGSLTSELLQECKEELEGNMKSASSHLDSLLELRTLAYWQPCGDATRNPEEVKAKLKRLESNGRIGGWEEDHNECDPYLTSYNVYF